MDGHGGPRPLICGIAMSVLFSVTGCYQNGCTVSQTREGALPQSQKEEIELIAPLAASVYPLTI